MLLTFRVWHHNLAVWMVLSIVQIVQDNLTNGEQDQKRVTQD